MPRLTRPDRASRALPRSRVVDGSPTSVRAFWSSFHVGLTFLTEPQGRRIGSVPVDRGASSVKRRQPEAVLSFANDRAVGSVTHGESRRAKLGSVRQTRRSQSSVCRCRTEPGAPRREVLRGWRAAGAVRARGQLRLLTPDQGRLGLLRSIEASLNRKTLTEPLHFTPSRR